MAEHLNTVHLTLGFSLVVCQLIHCLNIDRKLRLFHPSVLYGWVQLMRKFHIETYNGAYHHNWTCAGQILRVCGCAGLLPGVIGTFAEKEHMCSAKLPCIKCYLNTKITSNYQHFSNCPVCSYSTPANHWHFQQIREKYMRFTGKCVLSIYYSWYDALICF